MALGRDQPSPNGLEQAVVDVVADCERQTVVIASDFEFKAGSLVEIDGKVVQITHVLDLLRVVARSLDNGAPEIYAIKDLSPTNAEKLRKLPALNGVDDLKWSEAKLKSEAILSFLANPNRTRKDAAASGAGFGVSPAAFYRWVDRFKRTMTVAELLRAGPDGQEAGRLDPRVEKIWTAVVTDHVLTSQKKKPKAVWNELRARLKSLGLPVPHVNTVRHRMKAIPLAIRAKYRGGDAEGRKYEPAPGEYLEAKWPLSIIQIDHTPLDVIVVDDKHRKAIGRAWLTIAIDVYSRMVVGYYVYLEKPGDHSVGMCLANAMLPKDDLITRHNLKSRYPVWGRFGLAHADNAGEFRGFMLKRAAENNHFDIQWRPVKQPHYGAHIERLCGTLNHSLKDVPGATFSDVEERGEYDSEGFAVLTFSELEEWLAVRIVDEYHVSRHGGIGTTPLSRFEKGILGSADTPGRGVPPRIIDERRLRIDFTPYEERTVQNYGIVIDDVTYYADVLRPWINAVDPDDSKRKRKFYAHRDPRDISVVFFYDPELKEYFDIPYANQARPSISLWELKASRKMLENENAAVIDEEALFDAAERRRKLVADSSAKTKQARRDAQRRRTMEASLDAKPAPRKPGTVTSGKTSSDVPATPVPDSQIPASGMTSEIPAPFEDIE